MKLNKDFKDLQTQFFNLLEDGEATNEARKEAFSAMMDAQQKEMENKAREEMDLVVKSRGKVENFSSEEAKFYNAETLSTTNGELTLPEQSIERIFDDLVQRHELLRELGIQNAMLRLKVITCNPTAVSNWGKITEAIKGQILQEFDETNINQAKLTAYAVIPNDILEYGPEWVYRYISTQLEETLASALEKGFVVGTGNYDTSHPQPVGIAQQKSAPQTQKADAGTLTFADAETTITELSEVMAKLSLNEDGSERMNMSKVLMVVNTADLWRVKGIFTVQNDAGVYVENIPFGIKLIASASVPTGKAIFVAPDYYDGFIGGGLDIRTFDQTLAMEDATLMTGKMFAYGLPRDENVSLVYALPGAKVLSRSTAK